MDWKKPIRVQESTLGSKYVELVDDKGLLIAGVYMGEGWQGGLIDRETADWIVNTYNREAP